MIEPTPPCPSEPLTPREQRAAGALCMLQELAEIGMDMARVCGRRALAQEQMDEVAPGCVPSLRAAELSLAFERIARSIRLTLTLKAKIDDGVLVAELEAREKRRIREAERRDEVQAHKSAAFKATREVIKQSDRPECERERLLDNADGLFIHGDLPAELFERGVHSGLMADICKVLGVEPDWAVWSGESWALTEMIASLPGPYQHWRTNALKPDGTRGVAPPEQPAPDSPDSS
jgi:hypothetical protein